MNTYISYLHHKNEPQLGQVLVPSMLLTVFVKFLYSIGILWPHGLDNAMRLQLFIITGVSLSKKTHLIGRFLWRYFEEKIKNYKNEVANVRSSYSSMYQVTWA